MCPIPLNIPTNTLKSFLWHIEISRQFQSNTHGHNPIPPVDRPVPSSQAVRHDMLDEYAGQRPNILILWDFYIDAPHDHPDPDLLPRFPPQLDGAVHAPLAAQRRDDRAGDVGDAVEGVLGDGAGGEGEVGGALLQLGGFVWKWKEGVLFQGYINFIF